MPRTTKIIDSEATYIGTAHTWAKGLRVKILSVLRGDQVLYDDREIKCLRRSDQIEFTPEIIENGVRRFSWVTSDATLSDLKFDK
jgi:hypothetical protein